MKSKTKLDFVPKTKRRDGKTSNRFLVLLTSLLLLSSVVGVGPVLLLLLFALFDVLGT